MEIETDVKDRYYIIMIILFEVGSELCWWLSFYMQHILTKSFLINQTSNEFWEKLRKSKQKFDSNFLFHELEEAGRKSCDL